MILHHVYLQDTADEIRAWHDSNHICIILNCPCFILNRSFNALKYHHIIVNFGNNLNNVWNNFFTFFSFFLEYFILCTVIYVLSFFVQSVKVWFFFIGIYEIWGKKKNQTILQKQHIRLIEWMKGKAEYEGVFFSFENSD